MIVIALLGMSVGSQKSLYSDATGYILEKEGKYVNSIHVLLENLETSFIFFGTREAISKHKEVFGPLIENREVRFIEYDSRSLNDIFYKIIQILIEYKEEEILFDITHSFRDAVLMSVLSTIVTQAVYNPRVQMIYAKEIRRFEEYRYELVSESLLHTSNIAMVLSTFLDTLRVPHIQSKYRLAQILENFSTHLLSNQFRVIYEDDIVAIKEFIKSKREELFFLAPLLRRLEDFVDEFEQTKEEPTFQKFFFFADLFAKKRYYLHASTYLIEAITHYVAYVFQELGLLEEDIQQYHDMQEIVKILKFQPSKKVHLPNPYFLHINYKIIKELGDLREDVAEIRHNLAHINISKEYEAIDEKMQNVLKEFKRIIESKKLYRLDFSDAKKEQTILYQKELFQRLFAQCVYPGASSPKFDTVIDRYNKGELDKMKANIDVRKLRSYIKKYFNEIEKIQKLEQKRIFLIGDIS